MTWSSRDVFVFGPFRLDAANHELRRDGAPVPLKPKAFDLLLLLVSNSGRVLSKEELFRALWPGTVVEEASLTQNVYELRKALGGQVSIENLPKRGYRFAGEVIRSSTAERFSLAVLPLLPLVPSAGSEYLELGIADALITALTNLRWLVVRPISAVTRYAGARIDAIAAGRELHVAMVVEGSLQTTNERVRVTVRLLDVASGAASWAGAFDEPVADLFAVQDAIAARVAAAIRPELRGPEQAILTKRYTDDEEAYQLYLKGRYNWNKASEAGLRKAIDFFRAAIAVDPRYALAYVGIADAYTSLDWYGVLSTRESNPHAIAAAEQALQLDDTLAEGHASLAMARQYAWDWEGAEREYRTALALNPNYAPARQWYGVFLAFLGRFDEALLHVRRAQELDPVSPAIGSQAGLVLLCARRYDEAAEQLLQVLHVDWASVEARFLLAVTRAIQERFEEAIALYEMLPADNPDFQAMLAHACALAGDSARARSIVAALQAQREARYVPPFWLAVAHIGLGDREQALSLLEEACDDPDDSLLGVNVIALLDSLRGEPRFDAVLRRMRFPDRARRT
jgi:DNA-binding winged helix-turn-helix (wHTH) protein/tetratricopeptide (TPR) repeat protein